MVQPTRHRRVLIRARFHEERQVQNERLRMEDVGGRGAGLAGGFGGLFCVENVLLWHGFDPPLGGEHCWWYTREPRRDDKDGGNLVRRVMTLLQWRYIFILLLLREVLIGDFSSRHRKAKGPGLSVLYCDKILPPINAKIAQSANAFGDLGRVSFFYGNWTSAPNGQARSFRLRI